MAVDELSDVGLSKASATEAGGAAWGLASIGLGVVAVLVAPMILVLNLLLWQSPRGGPPLVGLITVILTVLGIATMLGLAIVGIGFGFIGRRIDRAHRRDSPLPTAGILLGIVAAIGWIMVGIQMILMLN